MVAFTDETTADLRSLIEADFGPLRADAELWRDVLYDWLNYRARLIPRQPREVIFSEQVKAHLSSQPAISEIAAVLRTGGDVSPWLSERVRRRKDDPKADLMFNDWQISHFHLGRVFDRPERVKRSGPLLFAYINPARAVLLDVQPHNSWAMQSLLRTLLHTSPADMNTEIRGILPEPPMSDDQLLMLRKKGVNVTINIDGRPFLPPGLALATSGAAFRTVRLGDNVRIMLDEAREKLASNSLAPSQMAKVAGSIGVPVRLGLRFDGSTFYAHEKNRKLDLIRSSPLT
ncbi:hypothetical protein [Methylobacterium sp. Leaf465]|uniref:hypothetical protein n=1 Tax=Methylobacterium sp. Leaf465 TaxID=1736385 RepID=UPI0009EA4853|nr:hypothetical protein [Methylobacterium sp. Leaf465]